MVVSWIPNVFMHMPTFKLVSDSCKINNAVFKYVLRGFAGLRPKCSHCTVLNSCWTSSAVFRFVIDLILQTSFFHLLGGCCPLSKSVMTFFWVIISIFPQTSPVVSAETVSSLNLRSGTEVIEVNNSNELTDSYFANLTNEMLFQCGADIADTQAQR